MATTIEAPARGEPGIRDTASRGPGPTPRRWFTLARRDSLYGYAFVAPALIGFAVFVLGPLVSVFIFSAQDFNSLTGRESFAGFDNYTELATNGVFARVLGYTAIFSLAVVPANIVLGLGLAVLVNQRIPYIAIFRTAFFIPAVISLVAWSLVWDYLLQANGGLNAWLAQIGITGPNWLADPDWALATVIVVQVLKGVGISMILFLAALQEVPEEVLEAAKVDGANRAQTFTRIVLPLISPAILLVSVLATINGLKAFAQIFLLTQGGPSLSTTILGYYIYDQAFNAFQVGNASAAAVVLFVIVLGLTLLQWLSRKRWVHNES